MLRGRIAVSAAWLAVICASPAFAQDLLDLCPCERLPAQTFVAGQIDNYAPPTDPASRGPELGTAFPTAIWKDFDDTRRDAFVGYTFANLPGDILCARLEIRLRPSAGGANNDTLYLGLLPTPNGTFAWSIPLRTLPGTGGTWNAPLDPAAFTLDLANLTGGTVPGASLLAQLNADRRLDIIVQDDTMVDFIKLTLHTFPEQTVAVGLTDAFAAPTDATSRGAQLSAAFPAVAWKDLDDLHSNRWIGHTFGNLTGNVVQARLEATLRPHQDIPHNDSLNLGLNPGPTFAFSTPIRNLPGAGGIWTNNPPTTFLLDLAALPGGANLLPKINADDRLDFVVQDDTAADSLRLRYRTCPAPRRFSGGDFELINNAVALPLPLGNFEVVTSGEGDGGVRVAIGDGDGFCFGTLACLDGIGTAYDLVVDATVQTLDQPFSATATLSFLSGAAAVDLSAMFPNPYDIYLKVEVWNQGSLVTSYTTGQGTPGVVNGAVAHLPTSACVKELDYIDTQCFRTLLVAPVQVEIAQGGPTVTGDEIRICRSVITGRGIRVHRLRLTTPNATTIPINGAAIRAFGLFQRGLGSASLAASPGALTVSGFGAAGTDGVALQLGAVDALSVSLAPLDPAAPAGAFLEAEAFGEIGGLAGSSLGRLRITRQAAAVRPFEVGADFAGLSSPTQRLQVLSRNQVVLDLPGHTGIAARASAWPIRIGKLGGATECYVGGFPPGTTFEIDGTVHRGDELRVLAETGAAVGAKSELQLRAASLPELTLTDIGVGTAAGCTPGPTTLCLNGGRFAVQAQFATPTGARGDGLAVPLTGDTGTFYFFGETNVELVVKALDACNLNSRFWVFSAGLTNVEVDLRVTDTRTGIVKHYLNPAGTPYPPKLDTDAFATCDTGNLTAEAGSAGRLAPVPAASPATAESTLRLSNSRFHVTAAFRTPQGQTETAQAVQLTDDTGYFWFFDPDNVEVILKTIDGCGLNSRFWVFAAGLTNVEVALTVTDTSTGTVKTYTNPQLTSFAPLQDTAAFATCP